MNNDELQITLIDWIRKRPNWFTYPLYDILNLKIVEEKDIERYTDLCINEILNGVTPLSIDFNQLNIYIEASKVALLEISSMENVNAIAPDKKLIFEECGLTVVYGDNGSGKSGYVRALKKACGIPGSEPIKGNIFSSRGGKTVAPKCNIKLSTSDELIECDLSSEAKATLKGVSIFDTSISNDYIGRTREASFEPRIFRVLNRLAEVIDEVKQNIAKKRKSLKIVTPNPPEEIREALFFKKFRNISHDTVFSENDFEWTETNGEELLRSKDMLDEKNISEKILALNKRERYIIQIEKYVDSMIEFFTIQRIEELNNYFELLEKYQQEYAVLSGKFFEQANHIDRLSQETAAWRNLWKYANDYTIYLNNIQEEREACPLCNQNMEKHILSRYLTIDDYVNNKIHKEIEKMQEKIKNWATTKFIVLDEETIKILLDNCDLKDYQKNIEFKVLVATRKIYDLKNLDFEKIERNYSLKELDLSLVSEQLNWEKRTILIEKKKYTDLLETEEVVLLKKQIHDLEAKKFCSYHKNEYQLVKESLQKNLEYEKAERLAVTNAITLLTSMLADEILLKEYEGRFNSELNRLTYGKVEVKLIKAKREKGRVPFKIIMEDANGKGHSPNEILSEGEQRVVSIAAYIADNLLGESHGPFVFDDPISSLDFEFEGSTINRIVDLAKTRQVIVFTHRISMVCALKEACKNINVKFNDISIVSTERLKGIPTTGILQKTKVKESLNLLLNTDIPRIKKIDIASRDYQLGIIGLCSSFRTIVEKSIEDILMCGITARFERNIHSTNVLRLKKLKDYDSEIVDRMMTKYSFNEHSQSDETPFRPPALSDIEKDITDFQGWATEASSRLQ